jgi:hypothetical protein
MPEDSEANISLVSTVSNMQPTFADGCRQRLSIGKRRELKIRRACEKPYIQSRYALLLPPLMELLEHLSNAFPATDDDSSSFFDAC